MDWQLFDEQWRLRHENDTLQALMEIFRDAAPDTASDEFHWRWRRARLAHFLAMQADEAKKISEVVRLYSEGTAQAKRAVEINKFSVEGHFWQGVCALEAARRKGPLALGAAYGTASKAVEQAMKIDEAYHFAGPVRVWARIQHFKPLLLGGHLDRALESYIRARQIAPHNSTTNLYYAEALWADRQPKVAREICEQLIAAPDDPDWIWEQARDRRLAAKLLEEINRARDT
ncbi:MAG TPA: TRAP transporter TatT component family protein [Abditibacteriaceae bacterium]|jgi:tetratricopeptide (TPR) repeat protein